MNLINIDITQIHPHMGKYVHLYKLLLIRVYSSTIDINAITVHEMEHEDT